MAQRTPIEGHEHAGHRQRMHDKFLRFGPHVFDTHELLEMLLYFFVPYRDTNGIAHRLLRRFGSLQGVILAKPEQLMEVAGIGPVIAGRLRGVLAGGLEYFCLLHDDLFEEDRHTVMRDVRTAGEFAASYVKDPNDPTVYMMLLDNSMRLISVEPLAQGPFSQLMGQLPRVIERALLGAAGSVMIFHTHPNGPLFSMPDERAVDRQIRDALDSVHVCYLERFILCGNRYACAFHHPKNVFEQPMSEELLAYIRSHTGVEVAVAPSEEPEALYEPTGRARSVEELLRVPTRQIFYEYFRHICQNRERCAQAADELSRRYHTVKRALHIDQRLLGELPEVGERFAWYLRLLSAIIGRALMERVCVGRITHIEDAKRYMIGAMLGEAVENIYLMFFDEHMRFIAGEWLGRGSPNEVTIVQRRIVELCIRHRAKQMIMAHNHPNGKLEPSDSDSATTASLGRLLQTAGIRQVDQFVVVGGTARSIADLSTRAMTQQYIFDFSALVDEQTVFTEE